MRRCVLLFFLSVLCASAGENDVFRKSSFGLWAHLNYNIYNADFTELPGVPSCCPHFTEGSGVGLSAGLLYEIPLSNKFFIDLRAGYYLLSGKLITNEFKAVNIDGTLQAGTFEHTIDAVIGAAGLEPTLGFRLFNGLSVNAGVLVGYIVPKKYQHIERITSPEGAAYDPSGTTIRLYSEGTLPESADIYTALSGRISWEFPLNEKRTIWVAPEFAVTHSLSDIVKDIDWGITSLRFGVALKFSPSYSLKLQLEPEMKELNVNEYTLCDNRNIYFCEPDSVEFEVNYDAEVGIEKYSYSIMQNGRALDWHDVPVGTLPEKVVWKVPYHLPEKLYKYDDSLHFVLQVFDKAGQSRIDSSYIVILKGRSNFSTEIGAYQHKTDYNLRNVNIEDLVGNTGTVSTVTPSLADFRPAYTSLGTPQKWSLMILTENRKLFDTSSAGVPPENITVNLAKAMASLPKDYNKDVKYIFELTDSLGNLCIDEQSFPVTRKTYAINSQLTAYSMYPTDYGTEIKPDPIIKIEEMISTRLQPLLNYIFFDENSSELPARYKKLTAKKPKSFNIDDMHDTPTLITYYNILNIIGKRMQEIPSATITITGCNSNSGLEKNNLGLSEQRAKAVFNYLNDIWDIPESRMKIQIRNLPDQASSAKQSGNQDYPDGLAENRRVEITSDNNEILKPLLTYGKRFKIDPPALYLKAKVNTDIAVREWNMKYYSNSVMIDSLGRSNIAPDSIFWDVDSRKLLISETKPAKIDVTFNVVNQKEQKSFAETAIPVEITSKSEGEGKDTTYDEYSLILFDFASDKIGESNQKIIDIIKQRVNPGATVSIVGHTDRVGSEKVNQKLSERRAKSSERALSFDAENFRVSATGSGESQLLYFNDYPEGRFYCRTVKIEVVNPVNK